MISVKFQQYSGGITTSKASRTITLPEFIINTETGWNDSSIFAEIRAARTKAEKNELKAKLNHFTPAVIVQDRRTKESIKEFTGLMQIDFDNIQSKAAAEVVRDIVFESCSCIVSSFLSPSGTGVKCLARIPVLTINSIGQYKALHNGFQRYFCIPKGLDSFYDKAASNIVLPMYASFDKEIRHRNNADVWTLSYQEELEIQPTEIKAIYTQKYNGRLIEKIYSRISSITGSHHPDLRNFCFWLGGVYASQDYQKLLDSPTEQDLKTAIIDAISQHPYMNANNPTGRVKTALDSFDAGKLHPKNMPPK